MSVDFKPKTFGITQPAASAPAADRPQAEFWINIGYESEHLDEETGQPFFISLPQGVPLDTQEPADTKINSPKLAAIRSGQNDLLDQLLEFTKDMAPGEARNIQLTVQVRRRKAPAEPIDPANNPLIRKLNF